MTYIFSLLFFFSGKVFVPFPFPSIPCPQEQKHRSIKTRYGNTTGKREIEKMFEAKEALEIMNSAPEKIAYRIENFLTETGISLLVGKPKCGKSTLSRQLAVAVAEVRDFLGNKTNRCD